MVVTAEKNTWKDVGNMNIETTLNYLHRYYLPEK